MKTSFRACIEDRQTQTGRLISENQTREQTMKRNLSNLIVFTAVVACAFSLKAGVSPHETISATIDGSKITITYGRPYSKKPGRTEVRKIWGGLVPYGKVWRTGADAATVLTTEQDLVLGETTLPAGKYTLFTLPA